MFYFVPTSYTPNTAATNRCASYIRGFSEQGLKTTVVYFSPNEQKSKPIEYPGIKYLYFWEKLFFSKKPFYYFSLLLYIFRFLLMLRSGDIVLLYGEAWVWYQILRFKKGVNIYVEHTENPEVVGIGGKFLTPSWKQYYKGLCKVSGMFVITRALKEHFVNKGVASDKIHIANITVDPHRFENVEKTQTTEKYIAYCGTASNNKDGVDQLIKSFSIIEKAVPNIKLYIIGIIPQNDEAGNLALIKTLGLEEKIVLTGEVQATEMPQLLKNAEALVLDRPNNTQAKCGFATKMGEYLLTKNPVIVTEVGDFNLFLAHKESVVFAEPDNINDFAEKVIWVLENKELATKIGKEGYNVAMKYFTYESVVKKIIKQMSL